MPRPKAAAHELTTEEVAKRMFPKEAREAALAEAQKAPKTEGNKSTTRHAS
jgi:hypothetical protein